MTYRPGFLVKGADSISRLQGRIFFYYLAIYSGLAVWQSILWGGTESKQQPNVQSEKHSHRIKLTTKSGQRLLH